MRVLSSVKARSPGRQRPRGKGGALPGRVLVIVHLDDGADFLGFNVRRYRGTLLIKPGKAAEPGQHDGGDRQRAAEQQPDAPACDCAPASCSAASQPAARDGIGR